MNKILRTLKKVLRAPKRFIHRIKLNQELNKHKYALAIGHMRSGSSLLIHLLASHPKVSAFGESQIIYHSPSDLIKLKTKSQGIHPEKKPEWYLDKILHDAYLKDPALIKSLFSKVILTYRDPNPTLASMVKTKTQLCGNETLDIYQNYYCDRLQSLSAQLEQLVPYDICAIHYETFISEPEPHLKRLEDFLELESPLSTSYKIMKTTGKRGIGDPSKNIFKKRILTRERGPISGEYTNQKCIDAFLTFEEKLVELKISKAVNRAS